jgi:flagellar biosynthesis protein
MNEAGLKRVVGLKYEPDEGLPQVILKGSGPLAEEILRRRDPRTGPQVVRNEALLQSLYRLPLDSTIGPELFHVVAAVLAHVFVLEAKMKREKEGEAP